MKDITLIAVIGKNRELGKNNDLIWSIPDDMKFFKNNTLGKPVVMGINTFMSLPKMLSNRLHIVLTHRDIFLGKEVVVVHSLDELLSYIELLDREVMIIGGAKIYSLMIEYANKMLLTEINMGADADVYFPEFIFDEWNRETISEHKYNGLEYEHVSYTRKKVK